MSLVHKKRDIVVLRSNKTFQPVWAYNILQGFKSSFARQQNSYPIYALAFEADTNRMEKTHQL